MKVRIINNKIAEVNIAESLLCNIELPPEYLGTHLSQYLCDLDTQIWSIDPNWTEPDGNAKPDFI